MENKKFDSIIIVSDMDGTFLGLGARVIPENIEAIEYFKENGGRFTFATGRTHHNIRKSLGDVGKVANAYGITVNGACIYDFSKNQSVHDVRIDVEKARELVRFCRENIGDVALRCSTPYGFLTDKITGLIKKDFDSFIAGGDFGIAKEMPLEKWDNECILKIVFRDEADVLLDLRKRLEEKFWDDFTFATSSPRFLELNAKGCSKAVGVDYLRREYSTDEKKATIIAVGDYENDIEMLKSADIAACPENAMGNVKSISKIKLCHHDSGAIANLIKILDNQI